MPNQQREGIVCRTAQEARTRFASVKRAEATSGTRARMKLYEIARVDTGETVWVIAPQPDIAAGKAVLPTDKRKFGWGLVTASQIPEDDEFFAGGRHEAQPAPPPDRLSLAMEGIAELLRASLEQQARGFGRIEELLTHRQGA